MLLLASHFRPTRLRWDLATMFLASSRYFPRFVADKLVIFRYSSPKFPRFYLVFRFPGRLIFLRTCPRHLWAQLLVLSEQSHPM